MNMILDDEENWFVAHIAPCGWGITETEIRWDRKMYGSRGLGASACIYNKLVREAWQRLFWKYGSRKVLTRASPEYIMVKVVLVVRRRRRNEERNEKRDNSCYGFWRSV